MEDYTKSDTVLAVCEEPCVAAGGHALKEAPWPVDSPLWSNLLAGAVTCGGTTLEQAISEGLYPVERNHAKAIPAQLQPVGRIHTGEVHEGLYPVGRTPYWCRGRP